MNHTKYLWQSRTDVCLESILQAVEAMEQVNEDVIDNEDEMIALRYATKKILESLRDLFEDVEQLRENIEIELKKSSDAAVYGIVLTPSSRVSAVALQPEPPVVCESIPLHSIVDPESAVDCSTHLPTTV